MTAEIYWERVHGVGDTEHSIYRAHAPGGWLVFHRFRVDDGFHLSDLVYVPDATGAWVESTRVEAASE